MIGQAGRPELWVSVAVMRRMRSVLVVCVLAAACGPKTGPVASAPSKEASRPAIAAHPILTISQGECQGTCPVYTVTLWSDGRIDWNGDLNVARKGAAHATIPLDQVAAISKAFADARYFDLDELGDLTVPPTCVKEPDGSETCTVGRDVVACTDTSHTTVTYVDGGRTRTTDDAHCQDTALSRLEDVVVPMLHLDGWITGAARFP